MTNHPASLSDLEDGLIFSMSGGPGETSAYLCRATGHVYTYFEYGDNVEELPDDIADEDKYIPLPDKHDLDLGRRLVNRFVYAHMDDACDKVNEIFSRRGAYSRFKDFLDRRDQLQQWYDYEQQATLDALRQWCEDNEIPLQD